MENLSSRGQKQAENAARMDMEIFMEAMANAYHPTENPKGKITLNVAENTMMSNTIMDKLQSIISENTIPDWVPLYTSPSGDESVRISIAKWMSRSFQTQSISPDNIALAAGAAAVLEVAAFILGDAGDSIAIPAPAYPMYTHDMGLKSLIKRYDIQTHNNISQLKSLALLTTDHLDNALRKITQSGGKLSMVMLTSPDNPSGSIYNQKQLTDIAEWCIDHKVHLIVNEIYGHSTILPQAKNGNDIVSFACIMESYHSDFLHMIYGLSKDFAISGLRVAIFHSYNEAAMAAYENVNIPHMVSNLVQWAVGEMFADLDFMDSYIADHQKQISTSYHIVADALNEMNIRYIPSQGSLFIWTDFSKYLLDDSQESELALWQDIYNQTGILITPGAGFGHQYHGVFRIVHTAAHINTIKVAMERLKEFISKKDL